MATLSYASPAASSRVRPSSSYAPGCVDAGTGWCARPTRPARPPAAASRRARARATRCGRPGDGRRRAARRAPRPATFANDTPTSSEPTRPGPASRRPRRVAPVDAAVEQRALDDAADVADVLARRQLRHDAAPLAMDRRPARRRRSSGVATGRAASPVSSTTAAAVSSQDVSMPRTIISELMRSDDRSIATRRDQSAQRLRRTARARCRAR